MVKTFRTENWERVPKFTAKGHFHLPTSGKLVDYFIVSYDSAN